MCTNSLISVLQERWSRWSKQKKSENRCCHCLLFRVRFSVLSFKNYYFSPLKGSTHWCLCWTYLKQSISFLLSKEIQLAFFSVTLYAMWPLQCNSLGDFQTGETLPDSRLLLQMIYIFIDLPVHSLTKLTSWNSNWNPKKVLHTKK